MTTPHRGTRLLLTLAASTLLAACAVQPHKTTQPAEVIARPTAPAPAVAKLAPAAAAGEPWAALSTHFVMNDCADSPLIDAKAAMYTRWPAGLEATLQQSLPMLMYVQARLAAAGIPGEFALLPMVESSYNPAEPGHHDAAGMWQLMPRTARLRGLTINSQYDGRLDPVASTDAAIRMLHNLHERFGDWRVVDMAYNAGPYAMLKALRHDPDAVNHPIPDLLNAGTRAHLAKLMALSCIVRDPARFEVSLPNPAGAEMLATVDVPVGTALARAAEMAGLSLSSLRALNPGYRGTRIPANTPHTLLLPANAAQTLTAALLIDSSESIAEVSAPAAAQGDEPPLPAEPTPPTSDDPGSVAAPSHHATRHHRVRRGETLWSIAHHYGVSVGDLRRWNRLGTGDIHPGEELRIHAAI